MKKRVALVVAVAIAFVAAVGLCALLAGIALSIYYRPTLENTGSGGIGAVSVGFPNLPVLGVLLFVVAAVFVNLAIRDEAKRTGRTAVWIRRAHLLATGLTLILGSLAVTVLFDGMLWTQGDPDVLRGVVMTVAGGVGAAFAAIHAVFGVFAIRLLRRG